MLKNKANINIKVNSIYMAIVIVIAITSFRIGMFLADVLINFISK